MKVKLKKESKDHAIIMLCNVNESEISHKDLAPLISEFSTKYIYYFLGVSLFLKKKMKHKYLKMKLEYHCFYKSTCICVCNYICICVYVYTTFLGASQFLQEHFIKWNGKIHNIFHKYVNKTVLYIFNRQNL